MVNHGGTYSHSDQTGPRILHALSLLQWEGYDFGAGGVAKSPIFVPVLAVEREDIVASWVCYLKMNVRRYTDFQSFRRT